MDIEILSHVFKLGKLFSFTPSSLTNRNPTWLQTIYETTIFLICVSLSVVCCVSYQVPPNRNIILFILILVVDISAFPILFCLMVVRLRWGRRRWFQLAKSLAKIRRPTNQSDYRFFWLWHVAFAVGALPGLIILIMGHRYQFIYSIFGYYIMFFNDLVACIVLRLIMARYRYLKEKLVEVNVRRNMHIVDTLLQIKNEVFLLRRTVNIFNAIFGWSFAILFFTEVLMALVYCKMFLDIGSQHAYSNINILVLAYELYMFVLISVSVASLVMHCDEILKIWEEIIDAAYRLDAWNYKQELDDFLGFVLDNKPEFTAARFFTIDRSTIFNVLNTVITFLLVLIQFK